MSDATPTYLRPKDLQQAWEVLAQQGEAARVAWTGPRPRHPFEDRAETLLDLSLLGLRYVDDSSGGQLRLGSTTTLTEIQRSPAVQGLFGGVLSRAVRKTAHHGLRNLATLGGALEEPQGAPEISAALLACGATVLLYRGSPETLELADYFAEVGEARPGLLVEARLDAQRGRRAGGAIRWVGRSPMDRAIVVAAACVEAEGGTIRWAVVALAGDGIRPTRLTQAEADLVGAAVPGLRGEAGEAIEEAVRSQVQPEASYRASADYQRHLAGVLARRAVLEATGEGSE